ncbi:MAG: hypothetical protein V4574_02980 [Pseudomonadota bacterium]
MTGTAPFTQAEQIARALARTAYETDTVRLTREDIAGCSHLVATRQGLFAVEEGRPVRVAFGSFYGLTLRDGAIFAFEACDVAGMDTQLGRVVRLEREGEGDRIASATVLAKGLDNGCHQIDFIHDRLTLLDSQNQRVLRFGEGETAWEPLHPLPPMRERAWSKGYVHINSLLEIGEHILLLLHNGAAYTGKQSEVAVLDRDWQEIARWPLPGEGCHNLVVLEDGTLISCGSMAGEIIGLDGPIVRVSEMMTRGLAVDAETIVVGAARFSSRRERGATPGTVAFLDRDYRVRSVLALPGAPTEIRRLDGLDLGLSAYRHGFPAVLRGPSAA